MYEERITELNAATEVYSDKITQFLALADFLYKDLGLIGEVHSRIDGDDVTYTLQLIDRPSTSMQVVKTFNEGGTSTDWEVIDLSVH